METAVFHVGAEDESEGAGVVAGEALEGNANSVLFFAEMDRSIDADPVAIAAGETKLPDGGVLGNKADALGPEGADFGGEPPADDPSAATGKEDTAVHGEVRMGVGGEEAIVLAADSTPSGAEVGHGSGPIGQDDVEVGLGADLGAFGFGGRIY